LPKLGGAFHPNQSANTSRIAALRINTSKNQFVDFVARTMRKKPHVLYEAWARMIFRETAIFRRAISEPEVRTVRRALYGIRGALA
jgi:hypothetical protein